MIPADASGPGGPVPLRRHQTAEEVDLLFREEVEEEVRMPIELVSYATVTSAATSSRPSAKQLLFGRQHHNSTKLHQRSIREETGDDDLDDEASSRAGGDGDGSSDEEQTDAEGFMRKRPGRDVEAYFARQRAMRRFGMWTGVFARCLLNIFGVIMFLRLGFVFGRAGILLGSSVVLVSALVTTITTMSLSAIASNGECEGGGAYYMISRALGPASGGMIGLLFGVANAIAIALYIVGLAETLRDTIGEWSAVDVQVYGFVLLVLVLLICLRGVEWVIKIQLSLLVLLVLSIISVVVGILARSPDAGIGFTGVSSKTLKDNWDADYGSSNDYFSVLSIFFPAVTGIMAGANISGELRKPSTAIPKGTLLSILVSTIVYIALGWLMASSIAMPELATDAIIMIRLDISEGVLVFSGIVAATLSSAIASLVGAPRVFQAVAKDGLFPFMAPLAKGRGIQEEPDRGYIVSFLIASVFVLVGKLDFVAPLITSFFILSYAMINYACFQASHFKSPGWRPSFEYYNKWVSLFGCIACAGLMFLINWVYAAASIFIGAAIFIYMRTHPADVNWGSAMVNKRYRDAIATLHRLEHAKPLLSAYRPSFLVLVGDPLLDRARAGAGASGSAAAAGNSGGVQQHLIKFVTKYLRKGHGLVTLGSVIVHHLPSVGKDSQREELSDAERVLKIWAGERATRAGQTRDSQGFREVVMADSFRDGARILLQTAGISGLRPNVVVLGFPERWTLKPTNHYEEYVGVVRDAFMFQCGCMIMRNVEKIDFSRPQHHGRIDVWWLDDDGGLTVLIPHLLTLTAEFRHAKLRVLTVSETAARAVGVQRELTILLTKMRISAEVQSIQVDVDGPAPYQIQDRWRSIRSQFMETRSVQRAQELREQQTRLQQQQQQQQRFKTATGVGAAAAAQQSALHIHVQPPTTATGGPAMTPAAPAAVADASGASSPPSDLDAAASVTPSDSPFHDPVRPPFSAPSEDEEDGVRVADSPAAAVSEPTSASPTGSSSELLASAVDDPSAGSHDQQFAPITLDPAAVKMVEEPAGSAAAAAAAVLPPAEAAASSPARDSLLAAPGAPEYNYQVTIGLNLSKREKERSGRRHKRWLRIAGAVHQHSSDAAVVGIIVPVPELQLSSALWLGWLDALSYNMPPTLLIRGNQQPVMTWAM